MRWVSFPATTRHQLSQFFFVFSLHFATVFDILSGPTDLREEGFQKKSNKNKNVHIHVKLKNKYIEKPLSRLLFLSFQFFIFASVASPFFYLLALRVITSGEALAKCYDRPLVHKSLLQTSTTDANVGKKGGEGEKSHLVFWVKKGKQAPLVLV